MTTFSVYYGSSDWIGFFEPSANIMAADKESAGVLFHLFNPGNYYITRIEREGLYNNNGRYPVTFKNSK